MIEIEHRSRQTHISIVQNRDHGDPRQFGALFRKAAGWQDPIVEKSLLALLTAFTLHSTAGAQVSPSVVRGWLGGRDPAPTYAIHCDTPAGCGAACQQAAAQVGLRAMACAGLGCSDSVMQAAQVEEGCQAALQRHSTYGGYPVSPSALAPMRAADGLTVRIASRAHEALRVAAASARSCRTGEPAATTCLAIDRDARRGIAEYWAAIGESDRTRVAVRLHPPLLGVLAAERHAMQVQARAHANTAIEHARRLASNADTMTAEDALRTAAAELRTVLGELADWEGPMGDTLTRGTTQEVQIAAEMVRARLVTLLRLRLRTELTAIRELTPVDRDALRAAEQRLGTLRGTLRSEGGLLGDFASELLAATVAESDRLSEVAGALDRQDREQAEAAEREAREHAAADRRAWCRSNRLPIAREQAIRSAIGRVARNAGAVTQLLQNVPATCLSYFNDRLLECSALSFRVVRVTPEEAQAYLTCRE